MIVKISVKIKKPVTGELLNAIGDAIHMISDILDVHQEIPFIEPDEEITLTGFKTGLEMKANIQPSELDSFQIEITNAIAHTNSKIE